MTRFGGRRRFLLVLGTGLVVGTPGTSVAQVTGHPSVDSANVARAAWARAAVALRTGDAATASRESMRAAAAWPIQPVYLWGRATAAARVADTSGVLQALSDLAALGLGADLRSERTIAPLLLLPLFAAVTARHDANRAPLVGSVVAGMHPDTTFWPEGIDYDARTERFYIGSVRHRTVAELAGDGSWRELWPRDLPGVGAVLGVRVDTARRVLWVTTSGIPQMHGYVPADSAIAALLRVRMTDGVIERRWNLSPSQRGHVLGDLAIGANGDVFISDSGEPVLYRLRSTGDRLEPITSPLFRSLQGVAPTPDGRAVYIADYSHGLLRLDIASGGVTRVDDAAGSTTLGCDGIVWHDGAIIAVQNGVSPARIMRFVLDSDGTRISRADLLDRNSTVADEPTIGTMAGGRFVYVATSQWEKHDDRGVHRDGARLGPVVLLAVPVRPR